MGIDSFLTINTFSLGVEEARLEDFSRYHVLRFSPRMFSDWDFVMKRTLDILGGLVGCIGCLLVGLFVAPAIYLEDPGPVIFKQKRVGRNGRHFTMYKFRSMYQDAEERKKELMDQNEMDGLMFKIKDDPRITKVGRFIRKTSLDEFPQFFNVLKGDMSLVGTRPPTVGEFEMYENHHKRRLSLKPGITGLWQVSGRSDITNFEDVVKLDLEYIDRWSFLFDLQILFRTVAVVFEAKGSE
jgi:exopolysaccharide biosynthesis polyprenyl glycosylphosphotransferase